MLSRLFRPVSSIRGALCGLPRSLSSGPLSSEQKEESKLNLYYINSKDPARSTVSSSSLGESIRLPEKPERPNSPWIQYSWKITNSLSIAHRATGVSLTVAIYGVAATYVLLGFNAGAVVVLFKSFPWLVKASCKLLFIAPFNFHTLNGVRHLLWDCGDNFELARVYLTGKQVVAGTGILSLIMLAFL